MPAEIKNLIICNPYEMPKQHWRYDRTKREFDLIEGRRPAGYLIATPDSKSFDDPGIFQEIKLVNRIRTRVDKWRDNGYPGITGITRNLLEFWKNDKHRENRFFFCQLEAIETLIWLVEGNSAEKQGISIPSDGGDFARWCSKMATGIGKTIVMGMVVVWQVVNKITYPHDVRFSKNILVMAPGLTVKSRLQVLHPTSKDNIYDEFVMVPDSLREKLHRANITIHNWHTLLPEEDSPKSVVKLGSESNEVFSRRILGHNLDKIIVINDEAHHAYRANDDQTLVISKKEQDRDKRWIEGLDKINNARSIVHCFDFSATPFIPSGKRVSEDTLFGWIVSDFSLNDAIESGLTKTPRIVIQDDANIFSKEHKSRFYHIYNDDEVKPDLNRQAKPEEPLPDLVANAYMLLGIDWAETKKLWDKNNSRIPPVMITVCNNTKTAARVMHSFENERFELLEELSKAEHLLHIDSNTIKKAEEQEQSGTGEEEELRRIVDTVGKIGKPGEQIRNIIAVQMLSEGWDARNVTHIMGLRAFSSQLLCEQVVGRGLRRTSYEIDSETKLYSPEYVNVFGVPFTFLPHEGGNGKVKTKNTTPIMPDPNKIQHEISWPNIDRIDKEYSPKLEIDWSKTKPLLINSSQISITASMADIIDGKAVVKTMSDIDLRSWHDNLRFQRMIFLASKDIYLEMLPGWKGTKDFLLAQIISLVERFIHLEKVIVDDVKNDPMRTKMSMLFNMQKIVKHVFEYITDSSTKKSIIQLNDFKPIKSTSDMREWNTKKSVVHNKKSHINQTPYDSTWELAAIQEFERNSNVISWVKNDHIGFVIKYLYNGILHDYWPDFIIKLENNVTLVLEIKGVDDDMNRKKRDYLKRWVNAVNTDGNYGTWVWDVAFSPNTVKSIISKHAKSHESSTEYAKCPKCAKIALSRKNIEKKFGYRNINGITRPQSWCRSCRTQ